jgi:succinate dehydrogenase / fumarate reductase cytochrome b subunit
MSNANRPLSPHLQVYRWEITMFLSILHRVTGVGLAVGAVLFTILLMTTIEGGAPFTRFYELASTPFGLFCAFCWLFAFSFHFLNGIRHLVWDVGLGFKKKSAKASGWFVLVGSFVLTTLIWNYARFHGQ